MARLQCATLAVPLDPADPDGPTIDLALARSRATGGDAGRMGSVVFNPGGPGGSGIEFLASAASMVPPQLAQRFDLVSFDPRGVGASTPVRCLDDEEKDAQLQGDLTPDTDEELRASLEEYEQFRDRCLERSGDMVEHMSTADVAADLDRIREAVGDERLTYVGFSYGTTIGAVYATLFPDKVRALVLDGATSPDATPEDQLLAQGRGFEGTLDSFVRHCDTDPGCALHPDARAAIAATRESLAGAPLQVQTASGRRELGVDLFDIGLATAMYDTTLWGTVANAIARMDEGGAEVILTLVDRQLGREPDGSYDNSSDAQSMVNCADTDERPTFDEAVDIARRVSDQLPTFGEAIGWGALSCLDWPEPANPLPEISAPDAPPIVVIGTVGDPATPYAWAEQMAAALESSVLLTYEGDGHTAFLRGGPCIDDAVAKYLIEVAAPPAGTRCPAQAGSVSFRGIRDEVVSQFVDAGLTEGQANCVVDAIISEVGSAEFDRLILTESVEELTRLVAVHAAACRARG